MTLLLCFQQLFTVYPHLTGLQVSGCSNYPAKNWFKHIFNFNYIAHSLLHTSSHFSYLSVAWAHDFQISKLGSIQGMNYVFTLQIKWYNSYMTTMLVLHLSLSFALLYLSLNSHLSCIYHTSCQQCSDYQHVQ